MAAMDPFDGLRLVADTERYRIGRSATLIVVVLRGEIDDVTSDAWRDVVQRDFDANGAPQFGYVDTRDAIPTSSLAARMRSAAFLRRCAQRMTCIALVVSDKTSFMIKTVLRVAGMGNVHFVEADGADDVFRKLHDGVDLGVAAPAP